MRGFWGPGRSRTQGLALPWSLRSAAVPAKAAGVLPVISLLSGCQEVTPGRMLKKKWGETGRILPPGSSLRLGVVLRGGLWTVVCSALVAAAAAHLALMVS